MLGMIILKYLLEKARLLRKLPAGLRSHNTLSSVCQALCIVETTHIVQVLTFLSSRFLIHLNKSISSHWVAVAGVT